MTNYEENTGRPTVRETVECESNTIYDGSSDPLGHIFEGIETAFIVKSREGNPAPSNITIKNYKFPKLYSLYRRGYSVGGKV